jgi:hypothetical protein
MVLAEEGYFTRELGRQGPQPYSMGLAAYAVLWCALYRSIGWVRAVLRRATVGFGIVLAQWILFNYKEYAIGNSKQV